MATASGRQQRQDGPQEHSEQAERPRAARGAQPGESAEGAPYRVREFREADRLGVVEINRRIHPGDRRGAEYFRSDDERAREHGYFWLDLVAETADGTIAGSGRVTNDRPWMGEWPVYSLQIQVDPGLQRRGIGSALCERLVDVVRERGGTVVRADVQETHRAALAFLEHHGFAEIERRWASHLDVGGFDFAAFECAGGRAAGQGIELTTYAAERERGVDAARGLYELARVCSPDVPSVDPDPFWPYEEFVRNNLEAPGFLADGWLIAKHGERYVGMSQLRQSRSEPDLLRQWFTCVLPEYRGRGIAMALKVKTVEYGRDHGHREIRTMNSTLNRPMLRINEALGFVKQPVWITAEKRLDGTGRSAVGG